MKFFKIDDAAPRLAAALMLAGALFGCARGIDLPDPAEEQAYWAGNMLRDHGFSATEAAAVLGIGADDVQALLQDSSSGEHVTGKAIKVLPYPGEPGNKKARRDTQASIFAPWDPAAYAVIDLPETISGESGILYQTHATSHTLWDDRGIVLEPLDWTRNPDGSLQVERLLPNKVAIGSRVIPTVDGAFFEMRVRNGSDEPLKNLRAPVCALLDKLPGFAPMADAGRTTQSVAIAKSKTGRRYVLIAFDHVGKAGGGAAPGRLCLEPAFPDCPPEHIAALRGRLVFYEGNDLEGTRLRLAREFSKSINPTAVRKRKDLATSRVFDVDEE